MSNPLFNIEKELFCSIAENDENAFRQLFHLCYPQLYPQILKITKSVSVSEDILQDTFLKIWLNRDKLHEIENPKAWIFRIAYFQAFTFLRKNTIHQNAVEKISILVKSDKQYNNVEESIAFTNLQTSVKKAIQCLPKQQKKIYQLSRETGLKNKEIATQLNLSEQSVKNTLVRALKFIRAEIEKDGHIIFILLILITQYFK